MIHYLHCIHLPRVCFPTAIDLAKPTATNDSVHREVVHTHVVHAVQLKIFPLTKPRREGFKIGISFDFVH